MSSAFFCFGGRWHQTSCVVLPPSRHLHISKCTRKLQSKVFTSLSLSSCAGQGMMKRRRKTTTTLWGLPTILRAKRMLIDGVWPTSWLACHTALALSLPLPSARVCSVFSFLFFFSPPVVDVFFLSPDINRSIDMTWIYPRSSSSIPFLFFFFFSFLCLASDETSSSSSSSYSFPLSTHIDRRWSKRGFWLRPFADALSCFVRLDLIPPQPQQTNNKKKKRTIFFYPTYIYIYVCVCDDDVAAASSPPIFHGWIVLCGKFPVAENPSASYTGRRSCCFLHTQININISRRGTLEPTASCGSSSNNNNNTCIDGQEIRLLVCVCVQQQRRKSVMVAFGSVRGGHRYNLIRAAVCGY